MLLPKNGLFGLFLLLVISTLIIIYQIQILKLQEKIYSLETNQKDYSALVTRQISEEDDIVVIYNRVPKTASTSFVGVAYDICKKNHFHVLHVNVSANSHVLSLNNQLELARNITFWNVMKPALYHGHFAYFDFSKFHVPKPYFINIIRRPLDRFISYYYFVRYGDNYRPYLIRKKHGNTSFDECVAKKLPECDPNNLWLQVPFFCGHAANCRKPGNKWALAEAKKNIVAHYLLVGVTEELQDFISILELTVPRLFRGALEHYLNSNKSHLRKTVQKDVPSEETVKKIKESPVWQMENELYEFVLEYFHFVKKHTLKDRSQKVFYEKIRPKYV
ncbi:heparin sulfate O-sulfotransferase-like isoform X2 [Coccinella septempunctata]|uniref:heparin sulfate O-sulfotransferase-like isoform X2 n=1 Tax=Coccinella septempunctata TaxID=41139 RepID=UPI001D079E28|nr:heparin sulfate O-sulfotransferase-like isoform X2 [Coccinella septempunctata]